MHQPLAKMLRFYHAALWANGAWTVALSKREHQSLDQLFKEVTNEQDERGVETAGKFGVI